MTPVMPQQWGEALYAWLLAQPSAKTTAPPVSPETQSALDRLKALWRQYSNFRSGPMPPGDPRFAAAMSEPAAVTWLEVMEAYYQCGRSGDRPPEFDAWMAGAWNTWGADADGVAAEIITGVPAEQSG